MKVVILQRMISKTECLSHDEGDGDTAKESEFDDLKGAFVLNISCGSQVHKFIEIRVHDLKSDFSHEITLCLYLILQFCQRTRYTILKCHFLGIVLSQNYTEDDGDHFYNPVEREGKKNYCLHYRYTRFIHTVKQEIFKWHLL